MEPLERRTSFSPARPEVRRLPARPTVRVAVPTGPRKSSFLKRVVVTGVCGSVLAFAGFLLIQIPGPAQDYKTEKVKRGTLIREVMASGPLVPALKAEIDSVVAGTALAVHADFGSEVEAGQPLAELDPATANLSLKEAEIRLGSARATVQVARSRVQQCKTLQKEGLLSKNDLTTATSELRQAEANARIAEASVSRARIDLERCTVRSPLKGVVITRNVTVGQSVDTGNGTLPLFVVASDLSKMQIEANVAESDIGGVREGMQAIFIVDAFPGETFKAQVTQVRTVPVVDQTVVTYPVLIETANEDLRLKPGMTASVTITVDHREDVLTIPNKALRFRPPDTKIKKDATRKKSKRSRDKDSKVGGDDGQKALSSPEEEAGEDEVIVYRLAKSGSKAGGGVLGQLEKVAIKTGVSDGKQIEVLEGLDEGDRVVVGVTNRDDDEKRGLFSLPDVLSGSAERKKKGR